MIDRILEKHKNITEFRDKILARLNKNKLLVFNKIQISELKVLEKIEGILDDLIECEFCREKFVIDDLFELERYRLCQNCISENYSWCEVCNEAVYNEEIFTLKDSIYCKDCYFEVKQEEYHNHKIKSNLINKLIGDLDILNKKITYNDLADIEFRIEGDLYSIESGLGFYRLGSWSANFWLDIGNNEADLLKAIDYNLGKNIDKLTNIYIDSNTEIAV
jgi:hypothetical protein